MKYLKEEMIESVNDDATVEEVADDDSSSDSE